MGASESATSTSDSTTSSFSATIAAADSAGDATTESEGMPSTDASNVSVKDGGDALKGTSETAKDGSTIDGEGGGCGEASKGLTKDSIKPPKCLTW